VVVAQRLWDDCAHAAIQWANAYGKLTVYDLDDDLWSIGPENSANDFWQDENQRRAVRVMRECQRCTTTGKDLQRVMHTFHDDVRIVPNAVADDWQHTGDKHEGLVIGWAGSNTHRADLLSVRDVLFDVLDSRDVRMEVCGCDGLDDHPKVTRLTPEPIETYQRLVSRFDIGIAPLIDNRFNRCKSDLKAIEYAGLGIPTVASKVGPYAASFKHGDAGYLAANDKDWRKYLLRLIDDAAERKAIGERAYRWAQSRRVSSVMPRWVSAFTV
jgi:glycosyltransferase involved in cell wall biosynthesis